MHMTVCHDDPLSNQSHYVKDCRKHDWGLLGGTPKFCYSSEVGCSYFDNLLRESAQISPNTNY